MSKLLELLGVILFFQQQASLLTLRGDGDGEWFRNVRHDIASEPKCLEFVLS